MRNRRLHRQARRGADPHGRAASPRISRLRLGGHRLRARQPHQRRTRARARFASWSASCPNGSRALPASRTRAGRRTASRAIATRTRTATPTSAIAVVHNGIIENAAQLRAKLEAGGVVFRSETDTEVLAHLIAAMPSDTLEGSVRAALQAVTGTYGLAVLDAQRPESIVVARNGSPVVLGIGEREMFVASDAAALVRHTQSVVHLDDGEIAVVRADGFETSTLEGGVTAKTPSTLPWTDESLRQGRLRALHAQGDRRAARGDPAHAQRPSRQALPDGAHRRTRARRARAAGDPAHQDSRLRLGVHCRLR